LISRGSAIEQIKGTRKTIKKRLRKRPENIGTFWPVLTILPPLRIYSGRGLDNGAANEGGLLAAVLLAVGGQIQAAQAQKVDVTGAWATTH
jgi:hypothetical protein